MSRFKRGDRVRGLVGDARHKAGDIGTVTQDNSVVPYVKWDGYGMGEQDAYEMEDRLELVTKGDNEVRPYQRKTYRLLKDTPTIRPGAILQEECDDGTQPYKLITPEFGKAGNNDMRIVTRSLVEDNPKWFVEVFPVTPAYMTADELAEWNAFKSRKKPGRKAKVGIDPAKPGADYTVIQTIKVEKRRKKRGESARRSEAMKASWARRKAAQAA